MSEPLEDKILDLETRISFQEHTIGELNDTVYAQQRQIDRLEHALRDMLGRLKQMVGDNDGPDSDDATERPPHY